MVLLYPPDERINVLAPIVRGRKGEFKKELAALRQKGFTRVRVDGHLHSLEEEIALDRRKNHTIEVLVDRLIVKSGIERRLSDSIAIALDLADDIVIINTLDRRARFRSTRRTARARAARGSARRSISIRRASCRTTRRRCGRARSRRGAEAIAG
jgi:excinuclease ABC subunit A